MNSRKHTLLLQDELTKNERETISFSNLKSLMVESIDKLPMPAEFRCMVGKGKKRELFRIRKEWVGVGWVGDGCADGTEPLLVLDDEDFRIASIHGS